MNPFDFFTKGDHLDTTQSSREEKIEEFGKTTLDAALVELREDFFPSIPYRFRGCSDVSCIQFNHSFIENLMIYFETDSLLNMPRGQRDFLANFIMYEDHYSTSALTTDNGGNVIGATSHQKVVAKDYTATSIDAQPPRDDMKHPEIFKALDTVLMNIMEGRYVPIYF